MLRCLRLTRRLTQEALAERAGVSSRSIRELERGNGRSPRPDTVDLLANALELTGERRVQFVAAGRNLAWVNRPAGHRLPVPGAGRGAARSWRSSATTSPTPSWEPPSLASSPAKPPTACPATPGGGCNRNTRPSAGTAAVPVHPHTPRRRRSGSASPMDNEHLNQLKLNLKAAHQRAGEPPYRAIARMTAPIGERPLSASTISRLFGMKKLPKWDNLAALLSALTISDEELNETWFPLWIAAKAANQGTPLEYPTTIPQEPMPTAPCNRCGAVIGDSAIHAGFHQRLMKAEKTLGALERSALRRTSPTPPSIP